ncbi:LCM-domain-containing protein [Parathielavia appendiculata]|uniref:tRNA wybutosine-synthesizing protein 4 n=1 Tax=Parathielavia appendiculata TaxID=2587402 RepID=A0AAN6Z0D0_9PEZI|nr:LCM-domain-containing protein [Parathielavia appendiculata]
MTRKPKPATKGDSSAAPPKSAQTKAQDDQVMATNNSSIVSKRSVEKLYYPNEPHFFRYFVKKFQRRAPLINRGYWLRLRAIDVLVRDFLRGARARGKRGVVVNLGCGSDVLPWQCLTRYPEECGNVRFVDVDFPDLIERKRQTVLGTPELLGMLTGLREKEGLVRPVVLESDRYVQIGCDLRDLGTLQAGLAAAVGDFAECEFIFVAEVSITYMETEGADAVIRWASTVGNAEFVLLEQILPDGENHPFASTMLRHFEKLNTQLKSVTEYPTATAQHARFSSRGWDSVQVWTLWQAWADETFLSASERRALDDIEEFDEWEEFALFASHYCVVHARAGSTYTPTSTPSLPHGPSIPLWHAALQFDECPGARGQRRFAAAMPLFEDETQQSVLNVLGLGTKSRLQSCDVFSLGASHGAGALTFRDGGPTTRMCHSLTDLGGNGVLLAGGRASPSKPLKDCWHFDKGSKTWKQTHDLPVSLYRHAVTALGDSGLALLLGGRGEVKTFEGCLVYHPETGWVNCEIVGHKPAAVYGAAISCGKSPRGSSSFHGLYTGGIHSGLISDQTLSWKADISDIKKPTIKFTPLRLSENGDVSRSQWLLTRFGATCVQHGDEYLIVGGVARDHLLSRRDEMLLCSVSDDELTITRRLFGQGTEHESINRPLFVGHSAVPMPDGSVVVVGGGATCFSMGTFWNKGVYTLRPPARGSQAARTSPFPQRWVYAKTVDIVPANLSPVVPPKLHEHGKPASITAIPRLKLETAADFLQIIQKGLPVVLEGLDLGSCVSAWTLNYLVDKIGADRKVVIHEAATQVMDFTNKNFRYITTGFQDFAKRVGKGDRLYLRALSHEKPSEKPAVLADDFPALACDFVLPAQLSLVSENQFSSVLRVSGPVNMWLHYDVSSAPFIPFPASVVLMTSLQVMANVYCQIGGSKRLLLFPPSDVEYLSFAPGASSSSIDVFSSLESPQLAHTRPQEAVLSPGDVLFLPPLWLHTATPTSDNSIAVNVFFRDLDGGHYASGRDVYGNRDLAAYEKARQDVGRIASSFRKLPDEARAFYILRLADELRGLARG